METLRTRFDSDVELDSLQVRLANGIEDDGGGLRIFPKNHQRNADRNPLIAVGHFEFHAPVSGLFFKPTHVGEVKVSGLAINIPPASQRRR